MVDRDDTKRTKVVICAEESFDVLDMLFVFFFKQKTAYEI